MTNSNSNGSNDRLEQITQNLATITSALGTLTNGVTQNRDRISRLESVASQNADNIETLAQFSRDSAARLRALETATLNLTDNQQNILGIQETQARTQQQLAENLAEIRAASEKYDRILDYLLRRDGER
ncbi:hypothetical protein [Myxosarcina sp. GI1]|uniref:hypothetical protein n=1 Tax=Myxosarcina sp. GI1 TaxID=1541065 RepID=UPI00056BE1F6|nr:hypothetical protein [Myxosarcina sp. GI1]